MDVVAGQVWKMKDKRAKDSRVFVHSVVNRMVSARWVVGTTRLDVFLSPIPLSRFTQKWEFLSETMEQQPPRL